MTEQTLREFFGTLTDHELLARVSGGLTEEALRIAREELLRRGLPPPPAAEVARAPDAAPYLGDRVLLARDLTPDEAHVLTSFLRSAGIEADTGDDQMVQMYMLLSPALGGAKIRVPQSQLAEAQALLQAFRRGEFALDDDFDVGDGGP